MDSIKFAFYLFSKTYLINSIIQDNVNKFETRYAHIVLIRSNTNVHVIKPCYQAFRFMVGPGHGLMILKYGPSLFEAVGPVDPSFLVLKNLTLIKIYILQLVYELHKTESTCRYSSQYSKTCLKQPLKNDKTKILITNCGLMMVKSIAECFPSPWCILQYF